MLDNNRQTLILDITLVLDCCWVMQGPTSGPLDRDETVFVYGRKRVDPEIHPPPIFVFLSSFPPTL